MLLKIAKGAHTHTDSEASEKRDHKWSPSVSESFKLGNKIRRVNKNLVIFFIQIVWNAIFWIALKWERQSRRKDLQHPGVTLLFCGYQPI